jgi:lysophospholipase L1-like esterase
MTPLAWAGVAAAGLVGWLLLRKKDAPKTLPPPSRVLLIGDSLAVGLASPLKKELAPAVLEVRAHVGSRASDWVSGGKYQQELDSALGTLQPEVVLISLGTNDSAGGGTGYAKHFKEIADWVRTNGAAPIFLGPPELPWARGEIYVAAEAAGFLIKAPPGLAHASDGVHLTPQGYAEWAKYLVKTLRNGVSDLSSVYDW